MITEIGFTAGDVWNYLEKHGDVKLGVLAKGIKKSKDLVLMSTGWLAREGHVVITKSGTDYKVALRKKNQ